MASSCKTTLNKYLSAYSKLVNRDRRHISSIFSELDIDPVVPRTSVVPVFWHSLAHDLPL